MMLHSFVHGSFLRTTLLNCAFVCVLLGKLPPAVLGKERTPVSDAQKWSEAQRNAYAIYPLTHAGNADAGKELFFKNAKIACAKCHEISGNEKAGPNLKSIADKYRLVDLIRHLLYPNEMIHSGYETVVVEMKNGKVLTGTLKGFKEGQLTIRDAEGRLLTIQRDQIEQQQVQKTSMMPANLIAGISQEQFADLIAYLDTLHVEGNAYQAREEQVKVPSLTRYVTFRPLHGPESKFANPVWFCPLPGFENQYVVVEHRTGKIWRMEKTPRSEKKALFLDYKNSITVEEDGLVCIEFHPRYVQNGRYFLKHSLIEEGQRKSLIVERIASADRLVDGGGESRRLLEVNQPASNHNGGNLAFGPDGYLYHCFGDGGPQKDPNGFSQNPRSFLGSMIRIDVDKRDDNLPYGIPDDNPFLNRHREDPRIRPETWAIGFREPWRFSFDSLTGDLWVGDVGQDRFEEVSLIRKGENHGWNVNEGFSEFSGQYKRGGVDYIPPVFAYPHSFGVSVTGGYVYRGDPNSSFYGVYIFGDFEKKKVWGLRHRNRKLTQIRMLGESPEKIASFGVDHDGEVYIVGYEGTIYQIDFSETDFPPVRGDWPQFRGPSRDLISKETGLLKQWPKGGPRLAWQADGLGSGYSSITISQGMIFTQGYSGNTEKVFALSENDGSLIWARKASDAAKIDHAGSRAAPTVDGDHLYVETADGTLLCLKKRNGQQVWRRNIKEDFQGGHSGPWGYSEFPLVDGNRVIVTPGGAEAALVALDKHTGSTIWKSQIPDGNAAAWSSIIVGRTGGVKQYIQFLASGLVGFRASDGQFLWRETSVANSSRIHCSTPVFHDGYVFAASDYGHGGVLVQLLGQADGIKAEKKYFTKNMKNHHGGFFLLDGHIYGTDGSILTCLDFLTGKVAWQNRSVGKGAVVYADGHLYLRSEQGTVALVEVTPEAYREQGRFNQPHRSDKPAWAYPVVAGGRLYLRDQDILLCYDVRETTAR